jgi:hypothetical protein
MDGERVLKGRAVAEGHSAIRHRLGRAAISWPVPPLSRRRVRFARGFAGSSVMSENPVTWDDEAVPFTGSQLYVICVHLLAAASMWRWGWNHVQFVRRRCRCFLRAVRDRNAWRPKALRKGRALLDAWAR